MKKIRKTAFSGNHPSLPLVRMQKSRISGERSNSAFTIVEIVVGVIIIGILATILIPVLVKQADDSKVVAAKRELEEMANAQERVALDLGYYLRLYALDDVIQGDNIALGNTGDIVDGILDEQLNTTIYTNPTDMFIRTTAGSQFFLAPDLADDLYEKLATSSAESSYRWTGPYYNIHRDETAQETIAEMNANPGNLPVPRAIHDIPTDPWGRDYLLFLRTGLVREPEGDIIDNANASGAGFPDTQVFDRPVVLSLGPNGVPGNTDPADVDNYNKFGKGDDLYRTFGY